MSKKRNKKGGAIAKLVIWSVVLVILVCAFTLSMIFGSTAFKGFSLNGFFSIASGYVYEDADKYAVGDASYADRVRNVNIEWTAGSVHVSVYDGSEVKIEEENSGDEDENRMRTRLSGGTIYVKYVKSGIRWFSSTPTKDLYVYLPEKFASDIGEMQISVVSADLIIDGGLSIDELDIDCVSGKIKADGISAQHVDIDTVSGNITLSGNTSDIDIDAVSAKAELDLGAAPNELEVNTVSGDASLTLPKDASFRAELDSVSGEIKVGSNFAGKYYKNGNGASHFDFETVSGNVKITLN